MRLVFIIFSLIALPTSAQVDSLVKNIPNALEADEQAEFQGGWIQMMLFLQKNAKQVTCSGENAGGCNRILIKFCVSMNGDVEDVELVRGIKGCPEYDAEIIRVYKSMPRWKPAKQKGVPVNCYFTLPMRIRLG